MAIAKAPMSVNFTALTGDYDLLQDVNIKTRIQNFFGYDEAKYQKNVIDGLMTMKFSVFMSGTQLKINDGDYFDLISDTVYDTEDYIRTPIHSIKIKDNGITGLILFNFL